MNTNNALQIELHVPDFEQVKSFYGLIGFEVVWERQPEGAKGYLVMKNDAGCIISFWGGNEAIFEQPYFGKFAADTKRGYGVEVVIPTQQNLADLETKVRASGGVITEKLTKQPWGLSDSGVRIRSDIICASRHPMTSLIPRMPLANDPRV